MTSHNAIKSAVLLALPSAALVWAGWRAGGVAGALVALAVACALLGLSWRFSHVVALRAARARPIGPGDLQWLRASVKRLADQADLPTPRLHISPSPQPNAFATGRASRHAVVVVTEGLLCLVPPAEVEAVVAHELAHVRAGDIGFTSLVTALATGTCGLVRLATFGLLTDGRKDGAIGPATVAWRLLTAPLGAALQLALSRSREFDADRAGAHLTGHGETLAHALERIESYARDLPMAIAPAQAQAWTVDPLARRGVLARAFSTHPPVGERVVRLRALSSAPGSVAIARANLHRPLER